LAGAGGAEALSLEIPAGAEIELHEHGPHVRLTGLLAPVQVGRQYPLELTFEHSGVLLATLNVDFPALRFR
jgi:copper(I)-binding protein